MLFLAFVCCACAQTNSPDANEQAAIIERVKHGGAEFRNQLQDFICRQTVVRSTATSDTPKHWKPLETQEMEVSYVDHKEHYKLLSVNGQTTDMEKRVKQGYFIPMGEFGSMLWKVFDPKVEADFTWDHMDTVDGRRRCTLRYRVPLARTTSVMQVNEQHVPMEHAGFVEADCDTGMVLRLRYETDPKSIKMKGRDVAIGETLDVRYGPVTIGEKEFFAPLSAEEIGLFYHTRTRSEIEFAKYRKYESSSTITFEPAK
jgi:hypothetical protein